MPFNFQAHLTDEARNYLNLNKMKKIIFFLMLASTIMGSFCKKESTDMESPIVPAIYFEYSIQLVPDGAILGPSTWSTESVVADTNTANSQLVLNATTSTQSSVGQTTMELYVTDSIRTTVYLLGKPNSGTFAKLTNSSHTNNFYTQDGQFVGMLQISYYDGLKVSGTFSGTLINENGDQIMHIKSGKFSNVPVYR